MKVLFLTHRLPYAPNRGDRIRAYHLLREMARFATVSLFSLVHDDEEAARARDVPFAARVTTVRATKVRNLLRGAARLASQRPLTHSLLDAPDARAALAQVVTASPPDVVVAFCSGMARFALERPLDDVPLVLDMVDVDSAKWADLAARARGPRRLVYAREASTLAAFETVAVRHAATTFVVNDRELETLRALVPDADMHVLGNGVAIDEFRPPASPRPSADVLFCGVLNYRPNEEGVIWFATHVWPRVRAARPDARFVVVGLSPTAAIRNLPREHASIDIVGAVPAVQPHLWQAAVSVAPLHVARGVQTKVLESLAAGVPAVVSEPVWSGLPVQVRAGCAVSRDASSFADAVVSLLNQQPAERRALAGRANVASLDWSNTLRPLEEVLRTAARRVRLAPVR